MVTITAPTRTSRLGHRAVVLAALLAPVLFFVGQAALPALAREFDEAFAGMAAHRDQLIVARLFTAAGAFLFLPAVAPVWWLAGRALRGGVLLRVGALLFGGASFFNGLSQLAAGYAEFAATWPGVPAGTGAAVYVHFGEGVVAWPIAYWSIPVFGLGALLIATGLFVSRSARWWVPTLMIVGVVGSFLTAGAGPIVLVGLIPFAASFIAVTITAVQRGFTDPVAFQARQGHAE